MRKLIPLFVFIPFLILIIILADLEAFPHFMLPFLELPYVDKVGHFVIMGLFALALNYALSNRTIFSKYLLLGSLIAIVASALEETSQAFFPTRTPSLFDFAASFLGIVCFSIPILLAKRKVSKHLES